MEKKKLETLLDKIAVWAYPKIRFDGAEKFDLDSKLSESSVNGYYGPPKEDYGARIIEIKADLSIKPCDWCGKLVNQEQMFQKMYNAKEKKFAWQYNCMTCRKVYNPKTKELKSRWANTKQAKRESKEDK